MKKHIIAVFLAVVLLLSNVCNAKEIVPIDPEEVLRFTEASGHHSVLERPFSETKQPPIFTRNDGTLNVY